MPRYRAVILATDETKQDEAFTLESMEIILHAADLESAEKTIDGVRHDLKMTWFTEIDEITELAGYGNERSQAE